MTLRNEIEHLSDGLRLVSYCPVCDTKANTMQTHTLGTECDTQLLHIQCRKCRNAFLALVLINQTGASSIGLLTDLTFEDVLKFQSNKNVNVNDVISAHEWLQKGMILMDDNYQNKIKSRPRMRVKQVKNVRKTENRKF